MAVNKIYIQVDYQTDNAQKQIDQLNAKIAAIGTASTKSATQATTSMGKVQVSMEQTTKATGELVSMMAAVASAATIKKWVEMSEAMERAQMVFQNFGTKAQAGVAVEQVNALAYGISISRDRAAELTARLVGVYKVPVEQAPALLKALADINAKFNASQSNLEGFVTTFGTIMERDRITMREAGKSMAQLGVQTEEMIKKIAGIKTQAQLSKVLSASGEQSGRAIAEALVIGLEQGAKGSAQRVADALVSAQFQRSLNQLQETGQRAFILMQPALIKLIDLLTFAVLAVDAMVKAWERGDPVLKGVLKTLFGIALAIIAINAATKAWLATVAAYGSIVAIYKNIAVAVTAIRSAITLLAFVFETPAVVIAGLIALLGVLIYWFLKVTGVIDWMWKKISGVVDWIKEKIKPATDALKAAFANIGDFTGSGKTPTFFDPELAAKQAKEMDQALSHARSELLKKEGDDIGAIIDKYDTLTESLKGNAKQLARLPELYALEVSGAIAKTAKEIDDLTKKTDLELIRLKRQTGIIEAETPITETFAQERNVAKAALEDRKQGFDEAADVEIARNNDIQKARRDSLDKLYALGKLTLEKYYDEAARLDSEQTRFAAEKRRLAAGESAKAEAEYNKATHKSDYDDWKKTQDEKTQYRQQELESATSLARARLESAPAQTMAEQQERIEANFLLEANYAKQAQAQALDDLDARSAKRIEDAKGDTAIIAEINQDAADQRKLLELKTNTDIEKARIESWKATNELIIEQQREVFDGLRGFIGEIFDDLTGKTKSVWAAIADTIKSTVLGMLKSIVTSSLAAQFAGLLGYGPVTINRRGPFGLISNPVFGGMGSYGGTGTSASSNINFATDTAKAITQAVGGGSGDINSGSGGSGMGGSDLPGMDERDRMMGPEYGVDAITPPFVGSSLPSVLQQTAQAPAWNQRLSGLATLRKFFGIGEPIRTPGGGTTPWSAATTSQKLGGILSSPGAASLETTVGMGMFMSAMQGKSTVGSAAKSTVGGALAGAGIASMFGISGLWGAALGAGVGLTAAGLKRGGFSGLAMDVGGGALIGLQLGGPIGAAIGAAAGAVAGLIRLAIPGFDQQVRQRIKQTYGIDISNQQILSQISDIIKQNYGGSISVGIMSQEVQQLVRLYAQSTGQFQGGLPRPMYSASFAQSAQGGLQAQPVYSGGQLVANPYTGYTTSQAQSWVGTYGMPGVYVQLNPMQANALMQGQVVQAIGANPAAVGAAATTSAMQGNDRISQTGALLEPLTVTR